MAARLPGSFRDPAGYVFFSDNAIYRRIEPAGREAYERLMHSGLYDALTRDGLLVAHEDLGRQPDQPGAWTVIRPERVPMVSYPYEWCFSQLRDAALLMLRVQRRALEFGLSLKDASAYNVQFLRGRPILIDTLSFDTHRPGPWLAYRQFCQHFYAPLLLIAHTDPRLARLSQTFIDGVSLPLASRLLPRYTWLRPGPLMHVHLHAKAEEKWGRSRGHEAPALRVPGSAGRLTPRDRPLAPLIDSLERAIEGLRWEPRSAWASYYAEQPSYQQAAYDRKRTIVADWLQRVRPRTVWDLGANTGEFSKTAMEQGASVVALDGDPACVELMYREMKASGTERLLPLVADLANPSPAIGWGNAERMTLDQRGPADLLLALALVHHLAIGNNVPFGGIAEYFSRLARRAIVEFVPRTDLMVTQMLRGREHVFPDYEAEHFERAFASYFALDERIVIEPSNRVLYLFSERSAFAEAPAR
jgi:hypothetical protein